MVGEVAIKMFSIDVADRAPGKDLSNPAMTLENNPLAEDATVMQRRAIEDRNMRRLRIDAKLRSCPVNGNVYAGIMDTRYKGGA